MILPTAILFVLLAGYIIGLGAVTVIDSLGFLGRKSPYWTEVTIKAHKVTKPLIWLGLLLVVIGLLAYENIIGFVTNPTYFYTIFVILILNGSFLSFYISPRLLQQEKDGKAGRVLSQELQNKITVSFLISLTGWWGSLLLLVLEII
jgi:hypothetical protein